MTHTIICPFYRVLGDTTEGECKTTIEEAKQSWHQAFKAYWDGDDHPCLDDEDEGLAPLPDDMEWASNFEDVQLVAGQTEAGMGTAHHDYFGDHPDAVCFGDDGWVFTLPWDTKDAD